MIHVIIDNIVILKGKFEMKNKNIIEEEVMFCSMEFKVLYMLMRLFQKNVLNMLIWSEYVQKLMVI
jgi:hypothetical protein